MRHLKKSKKKTKKEGGKKKKTKVGGTEKVRPRNAYNHNELIITTYHGERK